jgi:processive 1,2-diacylglycerol beta-glucosyltransferase
MSVMTRRILIVSVSAGAGHLRAAQAVEEALAAAHSEVEVLNIDAMDYVSAAFRRVYAKGYLDLVDHAPALWGYIYSRIEKAKPSALSVRFNRLMERLNSRKLIRAAREFDPHEILSVHPLPMGIFNRLKRKNRFKARHSVVVTDYDVHPLWIDPATDRYFAGCPEVAHRIVRRGIEKQRVAVTGIPIVPPFSRPLSPARRRKLAAELRLRSDRPTILTSAGGFGVGRVDEAIEVMISAAARSGGANLLIVTGRNSKLKQRLAKLSVPRTVKTVILGFVDNMDELMALAGLMVTKPGGLTSSECLARRLPMLIIDPIPGQEERNATYLLEAGAAWQASTLDALDFKLASLLAAPARLAAMSRAAGRLAHPQACFKIAAALARP